MSSAGGHASPRVAVAAKSGSVSTSQRAHRTYYSRVKAEAITASHKLWREESKHTIVHVTTTAAISGYRPDLLAKLGDTGTFTSDLVSEYLYAGRLNDSDSQPLPIVELGLVRADKYRPRKGASTAQQLDAKHCGFRTVPLTVSELAVELLSDENGLRTGTVALPSARSMTVAGISMAFEKAREIPTVEILQGSGNGYYLCYRRATEKEMASASPPQPITDVQVVFSESVPLGYCELTSTLDGADLSYKHIGGKSHAKKHRRADSAAASSSSRLKPPMTSALSTATLSMSASTGGTPLSPKSSSATDVKDKEEEENEEENCHEFEYSREASVSYLATGPRISPYLGYDDGMDASSGTLLASTGASAVSGLGLGGGRRMDGQIAADMPLIIFSRAGDSQMTILELFRKAPRGEFLSLTRSIEGIDANLNSGRKVEAAVIYLSYGRDLRPFRFSAEDLDAHVNLKYMTPLTVSLHLHKPKLALCAVKCLKTLLLSDFLRYKDQHLFATALWRTTRAVAQASTTFDAAFHLHWGELLTIMVQKFVHHLAVENMWDMLVFSMLPLANEVSLGFERKFVDTAVQYVRVVVYGDEVSAHGAIYRKRVERVLTEKLDMLTTASEMKLLLGSSTTLFDTGSRDEEEDDFALHATSEELMRAMLFPTVQRAIVLGQTEMRIIKLISEFGEVFSKESRDLVAGICKALFKQPEHKPWRPLATGLLFACRTALAPLREDSGECVLIGTYNNGMELLRLILEPFRDRMFRKKVPWSLRFMLRRLVSRVVIHNLTLCPSANERKGSYGYTVFMDAMSLLSVLTFDCFDIAFDELSVILEQVILPQMMETKTPFYRKERMIEYMCELFGHSNLLADLALAVDLSQCKNTVLGCVSVMFAQLLISARLLAAKRMPKLEMYSSDPQSWTSVYEQLQLQMVAWKNLSDSLLNWFKRNVMLSRLPASGGRQSLDDDCALTDVGDMLLVSLEAATASQYSKMWHKRRRYVATMEECRQLIAAGESKSLKKALAKLHAIGAVQMNGVLVAKWIHRNHWDLPASVIGEYIGGTRPAQEIPYEEVVRREFVRCWKLDFDSPLELLMDAFLTKCGFRMPKEAKPIERILESFAVEYTRRRPDLFENSDACFVLVNAILMLNTSLSNPHVKAKDRMKQGKFITMCTSIRGVRFSETQLVSIYRYVKEHPFVISFEDEAEASKGRRADVWRRLCQRIERRPIVAVSAKVRDELSRLRLEECEECDDDAKAVDSDSDSQTTADRSEELRMKEAKECEIVREKLECEIVETLQELESSQSTAAKGDDNAATHICGEFAAFARECKCRARAALKSVATKPGTMPTISEAYHFAVWQTTTLWPRVLDVLKVALDLPMDAKLTPLALESLLSMLELTCSLGVCGSAAARVAFDGFFLVLHKWWRECCARKLPQEQLEELLRATELRKMAAEIWKKPALNLGLLKDGIVDMKDAIYRKSHADRLFSVSLQLPDLLIVTAARQFWGTTPVQKVSANGDKRDYTLFLFSDIVLYASGGPERYRAHQVLQLALCNISETTEAPTAATHSFHLSNPQKAVTLAFFSEMAKNVCKRKVQSAIDGCRRDVATLIGKMRRAKMEKRANLFANSCAFLLKDFESEKSCTAQYQENCKLCLRAFSAVWKRRRQCPICKDSNICSDCFKQKVPIIVAERRVRKKICDGCLEIHRRTVEPFSWKPHIQ